MHHRNAPLSQNKLALMRIMQEDGDIQREVCYQIPLTLWCINLLTFTTWTILPRTVHRECVSYGSTLHPMSCAPYSIGKNADDSGVRASVQIWLTLKVNESCYSSFLVGEETKISVCVLFPFCDGQIVVNNQNSVIGRHGLMGEEVKPGLYFLSKLKPFSMAEIHLI